MIGIDMEMPKRCGECQFESDHRRCFITGESVVMRGPFGRSDSCPLHHLDDEIHVGDEVRLSGMIGTGINIWTDYTGTTLYDVLRRNGGATAWEAKQCIKTGRHFDEVRTLLQKMRGGEDG